MEGADQNECFGFLGCSGLWTGRRVCLAACAVTSKDVRKMEHTVVVRVASICKDNVSYMY